MIVRENYKNHSPALNFSAIVHEMLSEVPQEFLASLEAIVLTNSTARNPKKSRVRLKGRKFHLRHVGGLYHQRKNGSLAWIELFVDNLIPQEYPSWLRNRRFIQDLYIGKTLFHEIGHHIDYTTGRGKDVEMSAEVWRKKLQKKYMRRHYMYLKPVVIILRPCIAFIRWVRTKHK